MSAEENKAVIHRLFNEVYNAQNLDVLEELVAQNVVNHSAVAEHQHGIEGFRNVMEWGFNLAPNGRYELTGMIAEGDLVACRVTVSGTQQGKLFGIPRRGSTSPLSTCTGTE